MSAKRDRYVLMCQQAFVFAVVAAVVAPAAGIVTLDIVSPSRPLTQQIGEQLGATGPAKQDVAAGLVATAPVRSTVREVPMSAPIRRAAPGRTARGVGGADVDVVTAPQAVADFATVGVTWDESAHVAEGAVSIAVRTRTAKGWSSWQPMEYHDDHAPDAGSPDAARERAGTEPYVVGDVADVQVRAQSADGSALPQGLRLALVDPGVAEQRRVERPAIDTAHLTAFESGDPADPGDPGDPGDTAAPTDPADPVDPEEPADPAITPAAAGGVTPQPQIFSRAQWGADERMRDKSSLRYGEVHAGFVHHTVNANTYTRAQVPAILRGIYAYHTQSRGWSDIGYNFLVDRFGRIWEGRYGGVGRPVVGAHTLNYNDYSFAMSAIGNFDIARPPQVMLDAYGRLFAWKLSLHGIWAGSTQQWVGSKYFQAINGHRDAGKTACPGRYLYAQLPTIRKLAASYQHSFASRDLRTSISGTSWPDLAVRDKATGLLSVVRTGGQVNFGAQVVLASGFGAKDLIASPGDLNGDGYADVVARDRATKMLSSYAGTASGRLGGVITTTARFAKLDTLISVGDFDGDGRADLVGRDPSHRLILYPGRPGALFGASVVLASSWPYTLTTGVADFDRDGHPDLVARASDGRLFLVPGRGRKLGPARQIGAGFNAIDLIAGGADISNDGSPDLVARVAATKQTRIYLGDGKGGVVGPIGPYARFRSVDWIAAGGQFAGSAAQDVIGRNAQGQLVAFPNNGRTNIPRIVRTTVSLAGTNLLLNVGDWNHDGLGDLMTRSTSGAMQLRLGRGNDTFADPVTAGTGWSGMTQITPVGDVTGDGNNDLMARRGTTGSFMIYPGNGATRFRPAYAAHSAVTSNRQVAMGLFDADGAPDTMLTRPDGSLWLYPGNGPGGMTGGRRVLTGLQAYDWLVGLGDLDGDGNNDLLARAGDALYLIPGTATGFATARVIARGFGGYDLAG